MININDPVFAQMLAARIETIAGQLYDRRALQYRIGKAFGPANRTRRSIAVQIGAAAPASGFTYSEVEPRPGERVRVVIDPRGGDRWVDAVLERDITNQVIQLRDFKADPTGAHSSHVEIQEALRQVSIAGGGILDFGQGTYVDDVGALRMYPNVTSLGQGRATKLIATTSSYAFLGQGTLGVLTALSANGNRGDNTLTFTTAPDVAVGDAIWIQSEEDALNVAGHKKGELAVVLSRTSTVITIAGRLHDTYLTASTAKAGKVTPIRNAHIRDMTIRNSLYAEGVTPTNALVHWDFGQDVSVTGCDLGEANGAGASFRNCLDFEASRNYIHDLRDNTAAGIYGYGIVMGHASRSGTIGLNRVYRCRHGVTFDTSNSGPTPNYGVVRAVAVGGNTIRDCTHAGLDTHEDCEGVAIVGNDVTGGDLIGIQVRGFGTIVKGNHVYGIRGIGIYVRPTAEKFKVSGNVVEYTGLNPDGSTQGYGIQLDSKRGSCNDNDVWESAADGILISANGTQVLNVNDNECINNGNVATGDGIRVAAAVDRLNLVGNLCTDYRTSKTQRYGIRFDSAVVNTDRIKLVGNELGNNATGPFSNAGTGTPQTWANTPANAPGFQQRQRVTTGAVAAAGEASVTVTWATSFIDANYTIIVEVLEANFDLQIRAIVSQAAGSCVIRVANRHATLARTGTLHVVAVHD